MTSDVFENRPACFGKHSAINRQLLPISQTPNKARGGRFLNTPSKDRKLGGRIAALSSALLEVRTISIRAYRLFTFRPAHLDRILALLARCLEAMTEDAKNILSKPRAVASILCAPPAIPRFSAQIACEAATTTTSWRSGVPRIINMG